MSKKKGLSLEEKRSRLLSIFHDSNDVFVLKDIEKIGSKKGVVLQSIKDVLQSLVDDDMVHSEKIGSSKYFWSFPGETGKALKNKKSTLQKQIQQQSVDKENIQQQIKNSRLNKENTEQRLNLVEQLSDIQQNLKKVQNELQSFDRNDPQTVNTLKEGGVMARDSANRWLDNIYTLQTWMKRQFSGMDSDIQNLFEQEGLTDDIDYIN